MLLSAMTLAALLQAAPVSARQGYVFNDDVTSTAPPLEKRALTAARAAIVRAQVPAPPRMRPGVGFVRYPLADGCRTRPEPSVNAGGASPKARRLDQLPMADHTLAVLRLKNGCEVSSTVRYNVGR